MKKLLFLTGLSVSLQLTAQNLVVNPGFEQYYRLPNYLFLSNQFHNYVKGWFCPIDGTPDYFHRHAKGIVKVPDNFIGHQEPHSGDAYAGMILMVNNGSEYLESKLKSPLKKDSLYCLSLYISLADKSTHMVDKIGIYLSREKLSRTGWRILSFVPQVQNKSGNMLSDSINWTLIKGLYLSQGGEQYITIGNFKTAEKSNYRETFVKDFYIPFKYNAYYYIDDIGVEPFHVNHSVCKFEDYIQYDSMKPSYVIRLKDTIILKNLLFEFDSYTQTPEVYKELYPLVVYMKSHPSVHIDLYGHTDNMGSDNYNIELSLRRALFVANFLTDKGIDSSRVHPYGFGESHPIANNKKENGRAINRRVEFRLYYPENEKRR